MYFSYSIDVFCRSCFLSLIVKEEEKEEKV